MLLILVVVVDCVGSVDGRGGNGAGLGRGAGDGLLLPAGDMAVGCVLTGVFLLMTTVLGGDEDC